MLRRRKRLPPRLDCVDIDLNDHHGRRAYVSFAAPSAWQGTFEANSVPQPGKSTIVGALKAEASMATSPSAKKAIADAIASVEAPVVKDEDSDYDDDFTDEYDDIVDDFEDL